MLVRFFLRIVGQKGLSIPTAVRVLGARLGGSSVGIFRPGGAAICGRLWDDHTVTVRSAASFYILQDTVTKVVQFFEV
jgi:hypothetical protein